MQPSIRLRPVPVALLGPSVSINSSVLTADFYNWEAFKLSSMRRNAVGECSDAFSAIILT